MHLYPFILAISYLLLILPQRFQSRFCVLLLGKCDALLRLGLIYSLAYL